MARKTLKQKMRSQIRTHRSIIAHQHDMIQTEHEQAGITINFECTRVQSIAMAHGVMASLIEAKQHFDVESNEFKSFEKVCQARIGQCYSVLLKMGMAAEEANERIMAGH